MEFQSPLMNDGHVTRFMDYDVFLSDEIVFVEWSLYSRRILFMKYA